MFVEGYGVPVFVEACRCWSRTEKGDLVGFTRQKETPTPPPTAHAKTSAYNTHDTPNTDTHPEAPGVVLHRLQGKLVRQVVTGPAPPCPAPVASLLPTAAGAAAALALAAAAPGPAPGVAPTPRSEPLKLFHPRTTKPQIQGRRRSIGCVGGMGGLASLDHASLQPDPAEYQQRLRRD